MDEQCCGTCKDWQPKKAPYVGICKAPIPDCVEVFHKDYAMIASDGTKCPCYQKREASES